MVLSGAGVIRMHRQQPSASIASAPVGTIVFIHGHRPLHKGLPPIADHVHLIAHILLWLAAATVEARAFGEEFVCSV
jgi:hypothetical protein